jgi:hypothetical protein
MSRSDAFIHAFQVAAGEAVSEGLPMKITLKGGEHIEGVPESVESDASNRPGAFTPPDEEHLYGPMEHTVQIEGKDILAQEVREFTVTLPG